VGHESAGDGVEVVRLDHRVTPEAFDLHGFLLFRALRENEPARVPAIWIWHWQRPSRCGARPDFSRGTASSQPPPANLR
jgi:hypothetical protein